MTGVCVCKHYNQHSKVWWNGRCTMRNEHTHTHLSTFQWRRLVDVGIDALWSQDSVLTHHPLKHQTNQFLFRKLINHIYTGVFIKQCVCVCVLLMKCINGWDDEWSYKKQHGGDLFPSESDAAGDQSVRRCWPVHRDVFTFALQVWCGHRRPRPPPNVVWVIVSETHWDPFTPALSTDPHHPIAQDGRYCPLWMGPRTRRTSQNPNPWLR